MTRFFSVLLEQSLTACWVIPAVLLLRFCLKKAPKRITNLLWLVVAFRLICPVSFESNVSLVTQAENLSHAAAELRDEKESYRPVDTQPTVTLPEDITFAPTMPAQPIVPAQPPQNQPIEQPDAVVPPVETPREQPFISRQLMLQAGCGVWLAGVGFMALFGLLSTHQWRKRVQTAVRCEDGLWRSESVESPFILGVLRPKIYLPFMLPFGAESHVVAHEQAHLKRRDPLWKCFAFALLAVYWFHPLVWVSYFLFCRDIELACDQQVTRHLDAEGKKAYSRALLACTVSRDPLLCPLSFGEVGVKARIKAVLQKKPGRFFSLMALALCTVLIICCAANPKEEHPWDEAYRQTLEDLLKQYGANEDYGLQSVTTLDLWEDGVPELVVLRKLDETLHSAAVTTMMIYEYVGGEAVLRYDTPFSKTSPNSEIQWNRAEDGVRFMVFTPLTDKADYPNVQKAQVITVSNPIPDDWSVSSRPYTQMEDGRWIDPGPSSGYEARILAEEEVTALFDDTESLMELDWQRFLKKNTGATCYQRAYLKELETIDQNEVSCHTLLLDMDQDGTPELITGSRDGETGPAVYLLAYRPEPPYNGVDYVYRQQLNYRYGNDENLVFSVTEYRGKPVLLYYLGGSLGGWNDWIMAVTMENGDFQVSSLKADGGPDAAGIRSNLKYHRKSGPLFGTTEEMDISSDEFEALRTELLQNARDFDPSVYKRSDTYSERHVWQALAMCEMETFVFSQTEVTADEYAPVLQALIAEYGAFRKDEKTDLILGLKYAGLHDLGGDDPPELVTLVNTRDADMGLHFTLRVYCSENGRAKLIHQTELGGRYGQTDVSHTFNVGHELITYHTTNEWTEEIAHVYDVDTGTTVFRAVTDGQNGEPTRDELEQFWIDGEAVSAGQYVVLDYYKEDTMEIDVCWDVAPASRADLEAFLGKMGVDIDAVPAGYGETVAAAHYSRLSDLMAVHGTTPNGIVGAMLVDLEQDGVPELLVQHGMTLELYRYEGNQSRLIWSGSLGPYVDQSGIIAHRYIITTHIDTFCVILHASKNLWTEEAWRVITVEDGTVHEEVLRTWTEEEPVSFYQRNYDHFSVDGVEVSKNKYDYRLGDLLDGSMAVSTVQIHADARPNSAEYINQLLTDLAAGELPEIGDSAACATAWWLMANNDGEPLDEETALKFASALTHSTYPADPPIACYEGAVYMWNEPYDFCRYVWAEEDYWLILADREETTQVAKGKAYRLDENGNLRVAAGAVDVDTFAASLVGDFDGQTLVHRRYHTDCYSGMEGCEDCFRSDLILWNADRTESVKLVENEPSAELFTVTVQDGNWIYVTYQTSPSHSEYNQKTTLRINLEEKTCVQVGREGLADSPNVLMTSYPHVDDPYTAPLHAVMDNASTALLPQTWDERQLWLALEFPDRENWTLYRNGQTVYGVNRDGQTKQLDPICIELIEAMGMEHAWGTMWDYARRLHKPTGFVLKIDGQPIAVDSDFAMLDWFGANHSLMLDVEQLGELLNVPVEVAGDVIQTQPEGLQASLDYYGTWITVTDGKETSEVQCFYNPATFEGRHYVPADALQGLFSVAMTWSEQNDVWTLELTTLSTLKAMAADAAAQLGAVYTPRGPMEERLMVGYQTVVDYGGGQALMNFLPGLNRPIFDLGPVLHRMTMLDRGYLRTYESNGKVTQSLYAQTISSETIPLEYEEIVCIDQRIQLYSLKKDGKYGFASIPWGSYEATISPCRWEKPMTITEMCGELASYNATGEW